MTITQPTASVNTSAGTVVESATCFAPEHLREYLGGWCDDAQAAAVETHLLACPNCERTVRELELRPDTLLQSLQGTTVARSLPDRETSNAELVPIAAVDVARFENDREREGSRPGTGRATKAALEKVKQLMDVPHQTAADKEKAAWQPANREIGIYELLKPLGRGGMGAVYLANHRQLKKQVAIKLLPIMSAEDSDVRARFQREIRVVGRLNHPSIVAATDAGEIDGTQFLVMEYVPGLNLSRLARLLGKLPVADACELIRQVALGLSCAHAEGVVHRDVKPSNLMLDETGHIRILDFGLAQLNFWDEASVDLTTVGQLMGTLDYMAPEQAEFGGNVDYRADLYALGATLFRLLCGRPPLAAAPNQSPLEKLRLLANHQPPKLDTLCPEAPPGLVALVGSLLSRSQQDRPASAAHVAEQLGAFTESAELVGLLKRAQSKAAESPQLLKPEKLGLEKGVWNFEGIPAASATPDAGEFQTPFSRRIRRWLLAAALPLLIIAGILIKLETNKGQLVIESDIDNIKVQIVSHGQPVSGLTINHGTAATRLRADKYEVTIDGPSDGLTIENEQFTLKNGETVVARIRFSQSDAATAKDITAPRVDLSTLPETGGPKFDSRNLRWWLESFATNQNPDQIKIAFEAMNSLMTPDTAEQITHTLLKALPAIESDSSSVHFPARQLLVKANPGAAYYSMWVKEFEGADANWRKRLWGYVDDSSSRTEIDLVPIIAWAERLLALPQDRSPIDDEDVRKLTELLKRLLKLNQRSNTPQFSRRIVEALKTSPRINSDWWISSPLVNRSAEARRRDESDPGGWQPIFEREVIRVAIDTLETPEASHRAVAQACLILANRAKLEGEQRSLVLTAIASRLRDAAKDQSTITEIIDLELDFRWIGAQTFRQIEHFDHAHSFVNLNYKSAGKDGPAVALVWIMLDVVKSVDGIENTKDALKMLYDRTVGVRQRIDENLTARPLGFGTINLEWPQMTLSTSDAASRGRVKALWGEKEPSVQDWMIFCILHHSVMETYLNSTNDGEPTTPSPAAEQTATPPPMDLPIPNKSSSPEPLYEGKTLSEWLDMLSRERSPTGLKSALDACAALVSPETSERITQTILKVVPHLNGNTNLPTGHENTSTYLDQEAMKVLRRANSGSAYYQLWVKEFEAADEKWRERLWDYAYHGGADEKMLEPIVAWAEQLLKNVPTGNASEDEVTLKAANYLRNLTSANSRNRVRQTVVAEEAAFDDRVFIALKTSPLLGTAWWLSQPLVLRTEFRNGRVRTFTGTNLWPAAMKTEITRVAIETLENDDSPPGLVAYACMIVANGAELDADERSRIITVLNRRLVAICAHPESMRDKVETDGEFFKFFTPDIKSPVFQMNNPAALYLAMEFLDVVKSLNGRSDVSQGLSDLLSRVTASRDLLTAANEQRLSRGNRNNFPGGDRGLQLNWPDLTFADSNNGLPPEFAGMAVQFVWGNQSPTFTNWFDYCILQHPVMQDYLASIEKPADNAQPAEVEEPLPQ